MDHLHIDFETRSQTDLIKEGVYRYASDLTTQIIMMGWAINDEPVQIWTPDQAFPRRVIDHILSGGAIFAHNAAFERLIFSYVLTQDFPEVPNPKLRQWKCTAAQVRAHGLPGRLKDAARCLDLPIQKMSEGTRLITAYCSPGHLISIPPDDFSLMAEYCQTDVEVERLLTRMVRELTDEEWEVYWINEEVNDRGLPIDVSLARAAMAYGEAIRAEADDRIREVTDAQVTSARQRKNRDAWLIPRLTADQLDLLLTKDKKVAFAKDRRESLLACDDLDPDVRDFVLAVEEAGGATISKYEAFSRRSLDDRLCGAFLFSGGGQTGRFCIAENETIFVLRFGEVLNLPIQDLELADLVWDGEAFVEHEGLVFSGYKEVMTYDGITATPDHKVYTQTHGKVTLEEASQRGYALQVSGLPDPDKIQLGRSGMSDSDYQTVEDSASV